MLGKLRDCNVNSRARLSSKVEGSVIFTMNIMMITCASLEKYREGSGLCKVGGFFVLSSFTQHMTSAYEHV